MISFNETYKSQGEAQYIIDAISTGKISGDCYYTRKVEELLTKSFALNKVLMTTSATHALELAMLLINIKPGDEVIMPSFTFSSTANSVLLRGGKPVFAEVEEATLNIDPSSIHKLITDRTKAIVPVHYGGIGCKMDEIMDIAKKHKLFVIEDAAQGVNAKYKNKYLGSIGHMGCYSFHSTKNFVSGEGGALLINVKDEEILERADCIRQKGTDRVKFLRGEVDSYSWVDIGSSYSPSDILMAMLYGQLEDMDYITKERQRVHDFYTRILQGYANKGLFSMTKIPEECRSNYHIFYLLFNDAKTQAYVMKRLKEKNINATSHFVPLHSSVMGRSLGFIAEDLPVTNRIGQCVLRLPIYPDLKSVELNYIGEAITNILEDL